MMTIDRIADITSVYYYVFLIIGILIYYGVKKSYRWVVLFLFSIVFCYAGGSAGSLLFILISIVSSYISAMLFVKISNRSCKRMLLWAVISLNIGVLALFKYQKLLHVELDGLTAFVPLAISFYTFQLLAYILDCYWGTLKPEKNILKLAVFTTFFPQMVSGPISKWKDLGERIIEGADYDYKNLSAGFKRIVWGLMKKLAISNRIAVVTSEMWNSSETYFGVYIILESVFFAVQLYTDFSGCIDIALGTAECFGIILPENFKSPFFAKSIKEFWQRWHITLGAWARDYIMYPIQRSEFMRNVSHRAAKKWNRKAAGKVTMYLAMFFVWMFIGIWHGGTWNYIIGVGLYFYVILAVSDLLESVFKKIKNFLHINSNNLVWKIFQVMRTILLYAFSLIAFRTETISEYIMKIEYLLQAPNYKSCVANVVGMLRSEAIGGKPGMCMLLISLMALFVVDILGYREKQEELILFIERNKLIKWMCYWGIAFIVLFSVNISPQEFLYANF